MSEQERNQTELDDEFEVAFERFLSELESNAAADPQALLAAFPRRRGQIVKALGEMCGLNQATHGLAPPPVPGGLELDELIQTPASSQGDSANAYRAESAAAFNDGTRPVAQSTWPSSFAATRDRSLPPQFEPMERQSFGDFEIIEVLDSGGMGTVYRARQLKPIERDVALKVIKAESSSADLLARFAIEGKSLAMMSHPNIATVLTWGATEANQPYLVMELVEGTDLISFCTEHELRLKDRMQIFHQVCLGIQHAHQRGVLHRDIKPSNILVTAVDGRPLPKIIDFGLAKEFGETAEQHTAHTQLGQILGTLHYMSPEAAKLQAGLVDTRSDVFSLGVVLFELLTGTTPLHRQLGLEVPIDERLRRVRRQLLVRPSDRARGRDRKQLAGDLDAICSKALATEPGLRYASVAALAEDVERYLNKRPVLATQATDLQQYLRLLQRHWQAAGLVATIAATLLVAVGVSSWWAFRATTAERDATRLLAASEAAILAENAARNQAELAQAQAEAINQFLVKDLLALADPLEAESADLTMREAIDLAVAALEHRFEDQPQVEAEVRRVIAEVYIDTGKYRAAKTQLLRVLPEFTQWYGKSDLKTIYARQQLAMANYYLGNVDLSRRLLDENETFLAAYPPDDFDARKYKWLLASDRALVLAKSGAGDEAVQRMQALIEEVRREDMDDPEHLSVLQDSLSKMLYSQGRTLEATELAEAVMAESVQRLGPKNPITLQRQLTWLAGLLTLGRYAEAAADIEHLAEFASETLGGTHPFALEARRLQLRHLTETKDYAAAIRKARSLIDYGQTNIDFDYPSLAKDLKNLTTALLALDRGEEAVQALRAEVDRQRRLKGRDNTFTQALEQQLASLLLKLERPEEAAEMMAQAPEFLRGTNADPKELRVPTDEEIKMAWRWSFNAISMRDYESTLDVANNVRRLLPKDDLSYARDLSIARYLAGLSHQKLGDSAAALPLLRAAAGGPISEGSEQAAVLDTLGKCLVDLQLYDEALEVGLERLKLQVRGRGIDSEKSEDAWKWLLDVVKQIEKNNGEAATVSIYERLSQVGLEYYGASDARAISVQNQWALAMADQQAAIEVFRQARVAAGPVSNSNRAKLAPLIYNLGLGLERTEQWAAAESVWRDAIAEMQQLYRPNYFRVSRARKHLFTVLQALQRHDDSALCLSAGLMFDKRSTSKDVEVQLDFVVQLEQLLEANLCSPEVVGQVAIDLVEAVSGAEDCKSVETSGLVQLCRLASQASQSSGDVETAVSHISTAMSRLDADSATGLAAAQAWMDCGDAVANLGYMDLASTAWGNAEQSLAGITTESAEQQALQSDLATRLSADFEHPL